MATETQRRFAATEAQLAFADADEKWSEPRLILADDPDHPKLRIRVFEREPDAARLTELADLAGLPADVPRRTTRVLRWVRALREIHGDDIDANPALTQEFHTLIRGSGRWSGSG
ncbi:hypothetical protein NKH18_45225 [Streptomyces sp. M10(2022)]